MSFAQKFKKAYVKNYKSDHPLMVIFGAAAIGLSSWNAGVAMQETPDTTPTSASVQQVEHETKQIQKQLSDVLAAKNAGNTSTVEILTLKRQIDRGIDAEASKIKLDALRLDEAKKNMALEDKVDAVYSKILLGSTMPEAQLSAVLRDFNQAEHKVAVPAYISELEDVVTWRDECRVDMAKTDTSGLSNVEKTKMIQSCAASQETENDVSQIVFSMGGGMGVMLSFMFLASLGTSLRNRWYFDESLKESRKYRAERESRAALKAATAEPEKPVVKAIYTLNLD